MYRLGVEAILGLKREGQYLHMTPCIPAEWPGYEITYRYGPSVYHIEVKNSARVEHGVKQVTLDGLILPAQLIPLQADGQTHEVVVVMG
jgi:cellobiose phosphorylase